MVQTVQITVEIPHAQFLAMVDVPVVVQRQVIWSKQCRTLFGSSQLQFWDKVIDVPVIFNDTCPWRSRQLQFLDKVIDEPVIFNDTSWSRCGVVPQIMEEIGKVIQLVRIAVEQIVASYHRLYRKSERRYSLCVLLLSRLWRRATDHGGRRARYLQRHVPMVVQTSQFSDKDADVPVLCTTGAYGGPDRAVLDKC